MVEAVLFDLFETVVTEFDPHWRGRPASSVGERLGLDEKAFRAAWRARREGRYTGLYKDYSSVLREICSMSGVAVDEDLIEQLRAERLAGKAPPFVNADPAIVDMLERLRCAGIRIGLISNCAPEEVASWEASDLFPLFDAAIFSFRVGLAKPDPRIYLLACERLVVQPEATLFVGDGGSDELMGAKRAGLIPYRAVWFLSRWPQWEPSGRAHELSEYPALRSPAELVDLVIANNCDDGAGK